MNTKKFRKNTPVLVVRDVEGRLEVLEAAYELRSLSGKYHQVRLADGRVVQCHDREITKAA